MQRFQDALIEIKALSHLDLLYFSNDGELLASTCKAKTDLSASVKDFATSVAESQVAFGFHFIKVMLRDNVEGVLLVSASADNAFMIGKMAARELSLISESQRADSDRGGFMQHLLLGNLLPVDIYQKAKTLKLDTVDRACFLIRVEGGKDPAMEEILRGYFDLKIDDIVELDQESYILIKDVREDNSDSELIEIAKAIITVMQTEAMANVVVSVGNPTSRLETLPTSYQEAKLAMEVGRTFYPKETILPYTRLGIGRLIYQLPESLCEMFIKEVFGEKIPEEVYDEEIMETIEKFLENDLNISETARQLYVHRNTLVYRLERLQAELGLDIRVFEDAMTFRIAFMVLQHLEDMRKQSGI